MTRAARLILFLLLLIVTCYLLPVTTVFAQTQNQTPAPTTSSEVPNNLHNWTQNVMIEVTSALSCQLTGLDPINTNQGCLGPDPKTGKIGFLPVANPEKGQIGGAIGLMNNAITILFNPPVRTYDYIQNLAQNFGITKKTYAQQTETGFDSLKPLLSLWVTFRNLAYLVFVIVFVVIGLAIMLRIKIDPRTVMTIQNQIPKIIIGILLVTFSFAIAGFLIDLMWISMYFIYNLISQSTGVTDFNPVKLQGSNPFGAVGFLNFVSIPFEASKGIGEAIADLFGGGGGPIGSAIGALIGSVMGSFIPVIGTVVGGIIGLGVGGFGLGSTLGLVGGIIAFLIIVIALLIALFRLWITLIFAYVNILLDVVLAPFWIMGGLFPGSPINISGWLRHLIANLAAFPAVIAMFMLGKVFINQFGTGSETKFLPPLIGNPVNPKSIGAIIGLGIILMTPNVVNMLKTALKVPKIDVAGGALAGLGAGFGALKETAGGVVAYKSKMPKIGESEGFQGVLKRIFR